MASTTVLGRRRQGVNRIVSPVSEKLNQAEASITVTVFKPPTKPLPRESRSLSIDGSAPARMTQNPPLKPPRRALPTSSSEAAQSPSTPASTPSHASTAAAPPPASRKRSTTSTSSRTIPSAPARAFSTLGTNGKTRRLRSPSAAMGTSMRFDPAPLDRGTPVPPFPLPSSCTWPGS
ncbi:hypothetical protein DFH09DRAFT_1175532 [Mycena vulgaris]|nr:hypothetical protein DFH09DRAFT_1175532 [Mycena vulgaris]